MKIDKRFGRGFYQDNNKDNVTCDTCGGKIQVKFFGDGYFCNTDHASLLKEEEVIRALDNIVGKMPEDWWLKADYRDARWEFTGEEYYLLIAMHIKAYGFCRWCEENTNDINHVCEF